MNEVNSRSAEGKANQTFLAVYEELRRIARARLADQPTDHTLQTTALVHEAFIKLNGARATEDKNHFVHLAAETMRQILVDHARGKRRVKRGGGKNHRQELADVAVLAANPDPEIILTLEAALCRLEIASPRAAEVIKLRFFAGLSEQETAEASGLSRRTVQRLWTFARAWLYAALNDESGAISHASPGSSDHDPAGNTSRFDENAR